MSEDDRNLVVLDADRKTRRFQGKSDPIDAEVAAADLAGRATGTPKTRDGHVEALRALGVTAPDTLRRQLRSLPAATFIATCAALTPDPAAAAEPATATMIALCGLARRHQHLSADHPR
ncbi:hypothetical protein [Catellatospora sp. NPDC049609]|uniref:hypothetical protein n=1 Tax=Catellatospora sp. NPDC049609 TaxID=3155505 RepID=UPI003444E7A8